MKKCKLCLLGMICTALLALCACQRTTPPEVTDTLDTTVSLDTDTHCTEDLSTVSDTIAAITEDTAQNTQETQILTQDPSYEDDGKYTYSFIREYLDSPFALEIFKNIKYNANSDGNISGVYEIKNASANGTYEWQNAFAFEIIDGHLFCPIATVEQIREIESYTEQRIHSVTFTDNNTELVGDSNGYNNVENYYVLPDNEKYVSIEGVIFTKDGKTLVLFPGFKDGHYDVPYGVENIDNGAFGKSRIESITFPKTLVNVGVALKNSNSLEVLHLSEEHTQLNVDAFSPYVSLTVVYNGNVEKLDYLDGIGTVIHSSEKKQNGFEEENGILYISEGVESLLEIDLESLSEKTYQKIVIPSSMRTLPNVYLLKTYEYEVSQENGTFYSEDGIIYRDTNGLKILTAYPTLRGGSFKGSAQNIIIGSSAFRSSAITAFHLGLAQAMPHALDDCVRLEKITTVGSQDLVIHFSNIKPDKLVFEYDDKMKMNWPDFPKKVLISSTNGVELVTPVSSGIVFEQ